MERTFNCMKPIDDISKYNIHMHEHLPTTKLTGNTPILLWAYMYI